MVDVRESAAETRQSPRGVQFDQFRDIPDERAVSWGKALDQMAVLVKQLEPDLIGQLESETSAEYKSVAVIDQAQDPYLRAELVRIYVRTEIANGMFYSAVDLLNRRIVSECQIPELQNPEFVYDMYDRAMKIHDYWQAWKIAEIVANNEGETRIFKPRISGDSKAKAEKRSPYYSNWTKQANFARNLHIEQSYGQYMTALPGEEFGATDVNRLNRVWNGLRFSDDGYGAIEGRHPLANKIAIALCQGYAKIGGNGYILSILEESRLSEEDLERVLPLLPRGDKFRLELQRRVIMIKGLL